MGCRDSPGCRLQGGTLVVCYLRDVVSQLELRDLQSGTLRKQLPMPGLGSVASFSGRRKDTQLFFLFTGFTEPGAIYRFVSNPNLPLPAPAFSTHLRLKRHSKCCVTWEFVAPVP